MRPTTNRVLAALAQARMRAAPMFVTWCELNSLSPCPAAPAHVARFVAGCAALGIERLWPAIQDVSRLHVSVGLADPTLGGVVAEAISRIAGIDPPRSWPAAHKQRFKSLPDFNQGHWWMASCGTEAIAFAGITPSTHVSHAGYFCRVGVLGEHFGAGLQLRLMRAIEARARLNGWRSIVSDTTDNIHSANNFIRGGYRLFSPENPWAWPNTLYWRKDLQ